MIGTQRNNTDRGLRTVHWTNGDSSRDRRTVDRTQDELDQISSAIAIK